MANRTTECISVCAIIVSHNPQVSLLGQVVASIRPQVDEVLVVDNASGPAFRQWMRDPATKLEAIELEDNLGVGAAQNRGIEWARDRGFSHVLFLDQDSVPFPDMVAALARAFQALNRPEEPVAAVGPLYVDPRMGLTRPFVRFGRALIHRHDCAAGELYVAADFLISSGMLVPVAVFAQTGKLDEDLFIDNVDLEWCFRARAKSYHLYGVCDARMQHFLGESVLRIWIGRWFIIYRHSPLRQYYIARNRLLLYRKSYSPTAWIVHDFVRFLFKLVLFSVFIPPRWRNLVMILRGMRDALLKKAGRYDLVGRKAATDLHH